jgi:hypothetical protein
VKLDAVATVVTPNAHTSPISGERGAFFHVDVLEVGPLEGPASARSVGEVVFGDLVTLSVLVDDPPKAGVARRSRIDDVEGRAWRIDLVARKVALEFADVRPAPMPIALVPPELVPIVQRASGLGRLCWREHVVRSGDRLRIRAVVESSGTLLVVRYERAPVILEPLPSSADA